MDLFPVTNLYGAEMDDGSWTYHAFDGAGDYDAVLWVEADGWKATANPARGEATHFDLGSQPDARTALGELNRQAFEVGLDWPLLADDGYWLATVTDSQGTHDLAREIDYDDALAEISDNIALRPDVEPGQLTEVNERIDAFEDCQEFDDLKVGGKTYSLVEVGPVIDQSTALDELTARYDEMMRQSQAELNHHIGM